MTMFSGLGCGFQVDGGMRGARGGQEYLALALAALHRCAQSSSQCPSVARIRIGLSGRLYKRVAGGGC